MREFERTARNRGCRMAFARLESRAPRRRSLLRLGVAMAAVLAAANGAAAGGTAFTGTNNNSTVKNTDVTSNTGTINNNAPGVWTGNVLSNAGSINNNTGATWSGNVAGNSSGILNNIGASWTGSVVNTGGTANHGTWSGDIVSNFFGSIYNDGASATWTGNVLTDDSQIINVNGATWNGKVEGNNNAIFNMASSFWNGDVVADGGGSNGLTQIDNLGTWTGNVDSNVTEINNIKGHWIGAVLGNTSFIVNNYNDAISNPAGVNHAVWTGDVTNNGGFIINDHAGIWNGNVLANYNTIINQSGATWSGNVLGNAGAITNNATWTGNVSSNTGTLTNNLTWTGTVANAGIFNNNAGATLSGLLTNSGTTNNTGSIGGITTISGGRLTGNGTVANLAVANGSTFAPGAPGTAGTAMTVSGNLAFQSGDFYAVQVNPATASLARVAGTAALGGTVQASFAPGSYVSKQYTILTAAGGLGGTTFASLTNTGLPQGGADSLSYDANDVYLNLTAGFLQYRALNGNQQAVANALTRYFKSTGGIPLSFFTVSPGGLTQIDGEAATGAEGAAFRLTTQFLNLMLDPFVDGRSEPFGSGPQGLGFAPDAQAALPPDVALAYAGVLKAPPLRFAPHWSAWGGAYGGDSSVSGDPVAGSSNLSAQTLGMAGGMDYHASPDTTLGFALAGGGTNWGLSGGLGGGRSDALQAGGYGITHAGEAYLAGAASFTNHWFATNRTALGDQLTGRFQGQSYGARLESGYRFALLPWLGVTPYAAVQGQEFVTAAFGETDVTGGGFGLDYASMHAIDVRGELGLRLDDPTLFAGMPLILRSRVAIAHDTVGNPALGAVFEALPGASFIVEGAAIPKNSALASAGAQLFITPQFSVLAKFDGEFARGAQSYAGSGTLRYAWGRTP
jgi:hypothetical protein